MRLAHGQSPVVQHKPVNMTLFNSAFTEIRDMLQGKKPLSFKRAVWLTEQAYFDGKLDWNTFNQQVTGIKNNLINIVKRKSLGAFKTGNNYAIFSFMTDSIPENNYTPCTYDLDNFMGENDYNCFTVSNLMATKKGNCHSLPYLYKILANELGAEAYIATAPMHVYIRHKDEADQWWNLELTSGTFSRTSFIIESFNVSQEGIESGLYMKALSEKESIALCLVDLLSYYEKKGGSFSDEFVRTVYTEGLKHYPNSLLLYCKYDDLRIRLEASMKVKGYTKTREVEQDADLLPLHTEFMAVQNKLKEIGFSQLSDEAYQQKVNEITARKNEKK